MLFCFVVSPLIPRSPLSLSLFFSSLTSRVSCIHLSFPVTFHATVFFLNSFSPAPSTHHPHKSNFASPFSHRSSLYSVRPLHTHISFFSLLLPSHSPSIHWLMWVKLAARLAQDCDVSAWARFSLGKLALCLHCAFFLNMSALLFRASSLLGSTVRISQT